MFGLADAVYSFYRINWLTTKYSPSVRDFIDEKWQLEDQSNAVLNVDTDCLQLLADVLEHPTCPLDDLPPETIQQRLQCREQLWSDVVQRSPHVPVTSYLAYTQRVNVNLCLLAWMAVNSRLPAEQRGRRLILVTEQGAVGEMRTLLAVGADVGARGGARGWTALHVAASRGDVEATLLLVDAGAAVDARSTWQQWTPLRVAAERDRAAVARLLLRANADHKARDGSGWTPLHLAARCGNAEVVAALLEAGADRDATTGDSGATALDLTRENKDSRLMEMLS
ncbi:ankyrin repeat and protein kinase domain-containing protein 1-like [Schistocerca americana]|uniref:ankyrin repeat and protein kinase domain-containing protein 1-like n=1 Tax=Schistocerca americana TaxID=7009 RepID=UPI001F4FAB17|nr:ankyrin repeat and protein kinase domain-containing protein 1-like [Schistocerca americana]